MLRHSRKNRKGGDKLDDIQYQVDSIQQQLNQLKGSSSSMPEPMSESMSLVEEPMSESMSMVEEPIPMEVKSIKIDKTWVTNKDKKFKDGNNGRVALAFGRIITLLDNNISKGDSKKDWSTIKKKLVDANSIGEVQDVINNYGVSFASNYVAGTRRRRKGRGKKRTHRRR